MTRLYGRAPTNERVNDYVPDVRFERSSIISAVNIKGVVAPLIFKGTLDGKFFAGYIEKVLSPELSFSDIVVMDNCSAHKVAKVLDPIYKKGAKVLFLPPYSPDLNPIELMWSKMKSSLRKLEPRTSEELRAASSKTIDFISSEDIQGWFNYYGYSTNV
jgi:transposase